MPTLARDLLDVMLPRQTELLEELATYVRAESGSQDKGAVDRAGQHLCEAFETLGFRVERMRQQTCGDHLLASREGSGHGRLLALIHLDTVWPTGTLAENPFRVEAGRAYGPGVLDMKGGWVVLLSALRALRDVGWDGLARTTVLMSADEEVGSPTARPLIEWTARDADWALVMEGAREDGALVSSRGAVGALMVRAGGVTAHVPTLDGLGPQGANITARDEYVLVDSLVPRAALLAGIIAGVPSLLSAS